MDPPRLPRRTDYDAAGTWRIIQTRDFVGYVNTPPSPFFLYRNVPQIKTTNLLCNVYHEEKKMFEYFMIYIICSIQNILFITKTSALFYKFKFYL